VAYFAAVWGGVSGSVYAICLILGAFLISLDHAINSGLGQLGVVVALAVPGLLIGCAGGFMVGAMVGVIYGFLEAAILFIAKKLVCAEET
jgi:hypothetical protein